VKCCFYRKLFGLLEEAIWDVTWYIVWQYYLLHSVISFSVVNELITGSLGGINQAAVSIN
jgi:hypothetical protein